LHRTENLVSYHVVVLKGLSFLKNPDISPRSRFDVRSITTPVACHAFRKTARKTLQSYTYFSTYATFHVLSFSFFLVWHEKKTSKKLCRPEGNHYLCPAV
jgi:hypothetical protein